MRPNQNPPSLESLVHFMRTTQQVANLKLPERLIVLEALPRNANTKVDKASLRRLVDARNT
jgi:non-ribosomal peptide synthetase component E (peptide arylation enzyme)